MFGVLKKTSLKMFVRSFGLILFFYILYRIDFSMFVEYIMSVNPYFVALIIALNFPEVVLRALRWHIMLRFQGIRIPILDTVTIYLAGVFLGYVSPGKAGEISKAFYLKVEKEITVAKAFSSVLVDRLLDCYLLFFLGILGVWHFNLFGSFTNISLFLLILFFLFLVAFSSDKVRHRALRAGCKLLPSKERKEQAERHMDDLLIGIKQLLSPKIVIPVLLTVSSYFVFFSQCYLIALAIDLPIGFVTTTLFMAISNLVNLIPISISGIGTRDATLIYLFSTISLRPAIAVSYSLLVLVLLFVCTGLICAVGWWIKPIRFFGLE